MKNLRMIYRDYLAKIDKLDDDIRLGGGEKTKEIKDKETIKT